MRKQQISAPVSGLMLRGSLITLKRKCGKPTCACADGEPHTTPALSYSIKGKTHILTLRSADMSMIRQALNNYKMAVADLEEKALSGIRIATLNIMKDKRNS